MAQSGTPWTAENYAGWGGGADNGGCVLNGVIQSVTCGDYNADGYNQDYANVAPGVQHKFTHNQYARTGGVLGTHAITVTENGKFVTIQEPNGFSAPAPGTEGNEGRNTFRNPGLFEWDASVLKNNGLPWFRGEKANLQLRVDGFNVINHTNFGFQNNTGANTIDDNLSSGTFGQATSSLQPRIIQLGARFEF